MSVSVGLCSVQVTPSTITLSESSINPGESGRLSFTLTNTGDVEIDNLVVSLSSDLTLFTQSFNFKDVGVGEAKYVTTTYSALNSFLPGDYEIRVEVTASTGDSSYKTQSGEVVEVQGSNYLIVSAYTSSLVIDNTASFVVNLTNQGDEVLNDILIDLKLPDGFIPTTAFQFYINNLSIGASESILSNVFVEKGIEPDSYQFTLTKTADGYNDTDTLNVVANGVPSLSFSGLNLDPEIPTQGLSQTISVQVENIGSGKAYNVIAKLLLDEEVTGVTTEYLGTLERDDLTSAIFDITTPMVNNLTGSVRITYEDGDGNDYVEVQDLSFDVIQLESNNFMNYLIWIVIISVVAYFAYKKFIKKK